MPEKKFQSVSDRVFVRRRFVMAGVSAVVLVAAAFVGSAEPASAAAPITPSGGATMQAALTSPLVAPTPTIAGRAAVGATLTATAGAWAPGPVALAYQWRKGGALIAGATSRTYAVAASDAGQALSVSVRGSKPGYAAVMKTSVETAKVARGTIGAVIPKISGTVILGRTLTAVTGDWTPAPITFSYHWKRDGVFITGATGTTYAVTPSDLGQKITVTVDGNRPGYVVAVRTSLQALGGK